MTDNVNAPSSASAGPAFETDFHTANSAHVPFGKLYFGLKDTTYTEIDDSMGHRMPVRVGAGLSSCTQAKIDSAASGDITVVAATVGQTTKIYRLVLWFGGTTNIIFKDGATTLTGVIEKFEGGELILNFESEPWFTTSTNSAFIINSSAAVQISGRAYYVTS